MIVTRGLGRDSVDHQNGSMVVYGLGIGVTVIPPIPPPPYHPIAVPSSLGRKYDFFQFDKRKWLEDDEEIILVSSLFRR